MQLLMANLSFVFSCLVKHAGRFGLTLLFACVAGVYGSLAIADDSQPFYVEINEREKANGFLYHVKWRIPAQAKVNNLPDVLLPLHCINVAKQNNPSQLARGRPGGLQQRLYRCKSQLAGALIVIDYPHYNPSTSTLIKYKGMTGEQHTRLLSPSESEWLIPLAETKSAIAKDYTLLGMQHIWAGTDHLLFLLCLLWIAGDFRRVLITITGFTVAHSITLVLSALQLVRIPVPPVEAVIALSIVFLATEIVKNNKQTLTWRHPIAVSSSFGLLHGFGFAAALADIGLPQTELVTGLLFFNVGVEIGQVVFASVMICLIYLLKRYLAPWILRFQLQVVSRYGLSYAIGGLASFWLVERCMGF